MRKPYPSQGPQGRGSWGNSLGWRETRESRVFMSSWLWVGFSIGEVVFRLFLNTHFIHRNLETNKKLNIVYYLLPILFSVFIEFKKIKNLCNLHHLTYNIYTSFRKTRDTVLYKFFETGTSDGTNFGRDQLIYQLIKV